MKKYNFMRPLLLLAVAFLVYNITSTICIVLGAEQETAGNVGFAAMLVAALITFRRLNRNKR